MNKQPWLDTHNKYTTPSILLALVSSLASMTGCGDNHQDAFGGAGDGSGLLDGSVHEDASPEAGHEADTGPEADTGDEVTSRQELRDSSIFRNGSFEQIAPNGSALPAGWTCGYFGTGTPPARACTPSTGRWDSTPTAPVACDQTEVMK